MPKPEGISHTQYVGLMDVGSHPVDMDKTKAISTSGSFFVLSTHTQRPPSLISTLSLLYILHLLISPSVLNSLPFVWHDSFYIFFHDSILLIPPFLRARFEIDAIPKQPCNRHNSLPATTTTTTPTFKVWPLKPPCCVVCSRSQSSCSTSSSPSSLSSILPEGSLSTLMVRSDP